MKNKTTKD